MKPLQPLELAVGFRPGGRAEPPTLASREPGDLWRAGCGRKAHQGPMAPFPGLTVCQVPGTCSHVLLCADRHSKHAGGSPGGKQSLVHRGLQSLCVRVCACVEAEGLCM